MRFMKLTTAPACCSPRSTPPTRRRSMLSYHPTNCSLQTPSTLSIARVLAPTAPRSRSQASLGEGIMSHVAYQPKRWLPILLPIRETKKTCFFFRRTRRRSGYPDASFARPRQDQLLCLAPRPSTCLSAPGRVSLQTLPPFPPHHWNGVRHEYTAGSRFLAARSTRRLRSLKSMAPP